MIFSMKDYSSTIKNLNVNIMYSGPMWDDGIKGIAEMVKTSLESDEISGSAAKTIFSVFVEQVTNILMYSEEKDYYPNLDAKSPEASIGMLALGHRDKTYFIQTGNAMKESSVSLIKGRIDHLNSLDKKGLRQYYRECLNAENDNPDSRGAGLGLIEIARRASAPIQYSFEPYGEGSVYFTMYVEIGQKED